MTRPFDGGATGILRSRRQRAAGDRQSEQDGEECEAAAGEHGAFVAADGSWRIEGSPPGPSASVEVAARDRLNADLLRGSPFQSLVLPG